MDRRRLMIKVDNIDSVQWLVYPTYRPQYLQQLEPLHHSYRFICDSCWQAYLLKVSHVLASKTVVGANNIRNPSTSPRSCLGPQSRPHIRPWMPRPWSCIRSTGRCLSLTLALLVSASRPWSRLERRYAHNCTFTIIRILDRFPFKEL